MGKTETDLFVHIYKEVYIHVSVSLKLDICPITSLRIGLVYAETDGLASLEVEILYTVRNMN